MRLLRVAFLPFVACALVACPDLSGFTGGPQEDGGAPDAPADPPPPPPRPDATSDASTDAFDADAAPIELLSIDPAVSDDNESVDLTARGSLDWVELHGIQADRCASCMLLLTPPTSNALFQPYTGDDRTWSWTNGVPVATSSMSGGVYVEGVGSSIVVESETAPSKRVLTVWIDTFYAGATVQAAIKGSSLQPQSVTLAALVNAPRYAVKVHFAAAAGDTLVVTFTETSTLPLDGDVGNIAFSAVTLAAEP